MAATVAAALGQFGAAYLAKHALLTPQAKAWRAIVACRTSALGGERLACNACGHSQWQYHSCRNRHCPQCGTRAKEAWLQARLAQVLDVPYAHMVFTLPHSLNGLYQAHPRWVIDTLFACTAQTLTQFAANPRWLGGQAAFTLVLHTWTQDLQRHIHLHAVIACGAWAAGERSDEIAKEGGQESTQGIAQESGQWIAPCRSAEFLFPVHALSKVFRGKFMAALQAAHESGVRGQIANDPQGGSGDWRKRQRALYEHDWVVYAKTPMGGPAQVLEYLARYTHRTAIGNERICRVSSSQVAFKVRAKEKVNAGGSDAHAASNGNKKHTVYLDGVEFVRRFLLHVLPTGIKRIRHFGLLAPCKVQAREAARSAMKMPALNRQALESAQAFMLRVKALDVAQCPCCHRGRLCVVQTLQGAKRLPAPLAFTVLRDEGVPPRSTGPP